MGYAQEVKGSLGDDAHERSTNPMQDMHNMEADDNQNVECDQCDAQMLAPLIDDLNTRCETKETFTQMFQ